VNARLATFALAASLASAGSARAQQEPTVRVELDGDPRTVLEMSWGDRHWQPVCRAPCNVRVPLEARYRVNGDGIQPSHRFALPSTYGAAHVAAVPASASTHAFGIVLLSLGGASFVAGLQTMLVAVFTESCSDCIGGFASTTEPNVAWALMGGGLIALVAGGVLVGETRTQVDVSTADVPAAFAPPVVPERRALVLPPTVGLPVFGLAF